MPTPPDVTPMILTSSGVTHVPCPELTYAHANALAQLLRHILSPHLTLSETVGEALETLLSRSRDRLIGTRVSPLGRSDPDDQFRFILKT